MFVLAGRGVVSRLRGARWGEGQSTFSGNAAENEIITMQSPSLHYPFPPDGFSLPPQAFHLALISPNCPRPPSSLCCCPPGPPPTHPPTPLSLSTSSSSSLLVCVRLHASLNRDQPGGWMSRTLCCLSPRDNPIKLRNLIMDYLTCSHSPTHTHTDLHTCLHIWTHTQAHSAPGFTLLPCQCVSVSASGRR